MISNILRAYNEKNITSGSISTGEYVEFISDTPMAITVKHTNIDIQLEYSSDLGASWSPISNLETTQESDIIYVRGITNGLKSLYIGGGASSNAWVFTGANNLIVKGNLNNLIQDPVTFEAPLAIDKYCFTYMFYNCVRLIEAPELPAMAVNRYAYGYMFYGCVNLTKAPSILPMNTASEYCCTYMFYNCRELLVPPVLQAEFVELNCYASMFMQCYKLTVAPELPALTLAQSCYYNMFSDCRSIVIPPVLKATVLSTNCYRNMFQNAYALEVLPNLPATILYPSCYGSMFYYCKKIKLSLTQDSEYKYPYRIPTDGTGGVSNSWNTSTFRYTGGTWGSSPNINTIYYTTNPPI